MVNFLTGGVIKWPEVGDGLKKSENRGNIKGDQIWGK